MNSIKCGIGECPSEFQTEEALSPNARYVCKLHTPTEQKVFFQEHQFDNNPIMNTAGSPIGTTHIPHRAGMSQPIGICPTRALKEKKPDA